MRLEDMAAGHVFINGVPLARARFDEWMAGSTSHDCLPTLVVDVARPLEAPAPGSGVRRPAVAEESRGRPLPSRPAGRRSGRSPRAPRAASAQRSSGGARQRPSPEAPRRRTRPASAHAGSKASRQRRDAAAAAIDRLRAALGPTSGAAGGGTARSELDLERHRAAELARTMESALQVHASAAVREAAMSHAAAAILRSVAANQRRRRAGDRR
ncbi:hypothetical protein JL720_10201 [Aureococcus anophagefferens]|nr:hypothetical protein JL720_10201 [Aureococcus anophagefferens]